MAAFRCRSPPPSSTQLTNPCHCGPAPANRRDNDHNGKSNNNTISTHKPIQGNTSQATTSQYKSRHYYSIITIVTCDTLFAIGSIALFTLSHARASAASVIWFGSHGHTCAVKLISSTQSEPERLRLRLRLCCCCCCEVCDGSIAKSWRTRCL